MDFLLSIVLACLAFWLTYMLECEPWVQCAAWVVAYLFGVELLEAVWIAISNYWRRLRS